MSALRPTLLAVHRVVGLLVAVFLLMAGTTGCLLAFYHELDAALSPELFVVTPPSADAPPQDPLALRQAVQRARPDVRVRNVPLRTEPGRTVSFFVDPPPGRDADALEDDELFVDPYTGTIVGARKWGDLAQGKKNLMPFVYRLHYGLALDRVGTVLMGIVALLWALDCFVGAYLTLPEPPRGSGRPRGVTRWLVRWRSSWRLRTGKLFSLVFSWHRASGLWVWGMLLVFAWSSVGLNLREVYDPVMAALRLPQHDVRQELRELDPPATEPGLSWEQAHRLARAHMAAQAERHGFRVLDERRLDHDPAHGVFWYRVHSSLDVSDRYPATSVVLHADTGELVAFDAPTGPAAGDAITTWLYNLHWGSVTAGGLPYRVLVSAMGLFVAALSVTGVWIWWRKRELRGARRRRSGRDEEAP